MGKLIEDSAGNVLTEGAPPYSLPERLTSPFILALLSNVPGDDNFIGEVARHFSKQDKFRLRKTAKELGGDTWRMYCREAAKWAPLVNNNNEWNMEDFDIVYEADVGSWYADRVVIADSNIRFVVSPRGIFTFPEFQWVYGQNIEEHLNEYKEKAVSHIEEVKHHITSELVRKRLVVSDVTADCIAVDEFVGLASIPPEEWRLPPGKIFISVDEG